MQYLNHPTGGCGPHIGTLIILDQNERVYAFNVTDGEVFYNLYAGGGLEQSGGAGATYSLCLICLSSLFT